MSSDSDSSSEDNFDENEMHTSSDESEIEEEAIEKPKVENENEEDSDEDEIIKKFRLEQQKKRNHPPDLEFEDHVVDICFHPGENMIACASITGDVMICKYDNEETTVVDTWELHTKACRDIEFDYEGTPKI